MFFIIRLVLPLNWVFRGFLCYICFYGYFFEFIVIDSYFYVLNMGLGIYKKMRFEYAEKNRKS